MLQYCHRYIQPLKERKTSSLQKPLQLVSQFRLASVLLQQGRKAFHILISSGKTKTKKKVVRGIYMDRSDSLPGL